MIAVIASVVLTVGILFANWLPIAKAPQILLVNASSFETESAIMKIVEKHTSLHKVKARNLTESHLDMAIEVRTKDESKLVVELMKLSHITSASLVSHDGEVTF